MNRRRPRILITAGPTREAIDPVRFISNRSTGLMGYELARLARRFGFDATLISGPTALKSPRGVKTVFVETALGMKREVIKRLRNSDALLMASAVCDYRVDKRRKKKIKRQGSLHLRLVRNPDILKSVSKFKNVVKAGFALETENLVSNAKQKLKSKKLDFIVANRITPATSPFGSGRKDVALIEKNGNINWVRASSKDRIASVILNKLRTYL